MSRLGAFAAVLLAWTLTVDDVGPIVNGKRTLTVTIRNDAGTVVETRPFDFATPLNAEDVRGTLRHYLHLKKYPVPAPPAPGAGAVLSVD